MAPVDCDRATWRSRYGVELYAHAGLAMARKSERQREKAARSLLDSHPVIAVAALLTPSHCLLITARLHLGHRPQKEAGLSPPRPQLFQCDIRRQRTS